MCVIAEIISSLKDIILAGSAITGACVAVKGLNIWKEQAKWKEDKTLAKNILLHLYRLNDEIRNVRNPFVSSSEQEHALSEEDKESYNKNQYSDDIRFKGYSGAIEKRWSKMVDAKQKLYPLLVESDVLWGEELSNLLKPINKKIFELQSALTDNLVMRNPKTPNTRRNNISERRQKRQDIIFESGDEDVFKKDIDAILDATIEYLKPKLDRPT